MTAIAVERGFSRGSEAAFREWAQQLAAGNAFEPALEIGAGSASRDLEQVVGETADRHALSLFVFARDGTRLTPATSRGVELSSVPGASAALKRSLAGRRYADTSSELHATVVGLPLRAEGLAALVAYAPHPELAAELGLVRDESVEAALWALVVGALFGAVLATRIARRLRRIAATAAAIEGGEFDRSIRPGFRDELGQLAASLFDPGAERAEARAYPSEDTSYLIVGLPPGSDGETAVLVVADVSERERLERAEREFVTNAAHELRTPLTTIVGAVEQLQAGSKDVPEERERFLAHLERESGRLARLVRALLVLARAQTRQESPRFVPVDVQRALEQAAEVAQPAEGVAVTVSCAGGLTVNADPDLLEQAVANLVANAVKHTARGRIDLVGQPSGTGGVAIEVRDSGPGMTAAERTAATRRFVRGSAAGAEGFGLGLAIVQQAAAALGGELELESVPTRGTTARLRLPAAEKAA